MLCYPRGKFDLKKREKLVELLKIIAITLIVC